MVYKKNISYISSIYLFIYYILLTQHRLISENDELEKKKKIIYESIVFSFSLKLYFLNCIVV